jgi:hypothetical protein
MKIRPSYSATAVMVVAAGLVSCVSGDRPLDPTVKTLGTAIDPGAGSFRVAVSALAGGDGVALDGTAVSVNRARGEIACRAALVNGSDRPLYAPLRLIVTDLGPDSVRILRADSHTPEGAAVIDWSSRLGGDDVLAPGETSARRPLVFAAPAGKAFALDAVLVSGIGPPHSALGGVVFLDHIPNGRRDRGEEGLPGIPITLRKDSRKAAETVTDNDGRYLFTGLPRGTYSVLKNGSDLATVTPNPLRVALVPGDKGPPPSFLAADFACFRRPAPGAESVLLGPLRAPASGETTTGSFLLAELPRRPLVLAVEILCGVEEDLADIEVLVNGHSVVTAADFATGVATGAREVQREVEREIMPDLLRVGGNTVEARATGGGSEGCLVVSVQRRPR